MSSDSMELILARLEALDAKLNALEEQSRPSGRPAHTPGPQQKVAPLSEPAAHHANQSSDVGDEARQRPKPFAQKPFAQKPFTQKPDFSALHTTGGLTTANDTDGQNPLGIIAVICFALASLLLVKFSIASGWLTPMRQLIVASVTGISFTLTGFLNISNDKKYMSQIPATGIVILNFVVYGAVFWHEFMPPILGLACLSAIALFAMFLVVKLNEEIHATLAVIGIYAGSFIFSGTFEKFSDWAVFLVFWSVVFSFFSIVSENRKVLVLAGYAGLGLFGLRAFTLIGQANFNVADVFEIAVVQSLQFLVFAFGTAAFSVFHKSRLEKDDAWLFFPLILFYYGQVYFFLNNKHSANLPTIFAVAFSAVLFLIYKFAQRNLQTELKSGAMVYSAICIILTHSVYLVAMSNGLKIFSVLLAGGIAIFLPQSIRSENVPGPVKFSVGFMLLYSYLLVFTGQHSLNQRLFYSFALGAVLLFLFRRNADSKVGDGRMSGVSEVILIVAHLQIMSGVWISQEYLSKFAVAPLWIVYAIFVLGWASVRRDAAVARHGVLIVCVAFARFILFQFFFFEIGAKIASLFVLGGLVFLSGYLYRSAIRNIDSAG